MHTKRDKFSRSLFGLLVLTCSLTYPLVGWSANHALTVGIDNYAPGYASALSGCTNDANSMYGITQLNSNIWPAANSLRLFDAAATKSAIRTWLSQKAAATVSGDTVFYFQSGHGGQHSGTDTYICSYDSNYEDYELAADLLAFRDGVKIVIVVDACHSGGLFKDASGSNTWPLATSVMAKYVALAGASRQAKAASVGWITAADYDQLSWAGRPYSLFTGYMINSFTHGDSNSDGSISFYELFNRAGPLASAINPSQTAQILNSSVLEAVALGSRPDIGSLLGATQQVWVAGSKYTGDAPYVTKWQTASTGGCIEFGHNLGSSSGGEYAFVSTTIQGPAQLSFQWRSSCEASWDYFGFYTNFGYAGEVSGNTGWIQTNFTFASGVHTALWYFAKDDSVDANVDSAWLQSVTITPLTVNNSPTNISLSASSINENVGANSTIGTLSTTDPDAGNTFTYTLVAGAGDTDNASLNISGSSLRITASPNYEAKSSYSIRVQSTDQGTLSTQKVFTITINDLNEPPTNISLSASSINENVAANSTIGTLSTTDPDAGNTFTYTLVAGAGDTDNAALNISGSSLRITASPNYEAKSSYSIRVQSTDQGTLSTQKVFTITINDLNEPAPTFETPEMHSGGTTVLRWSSITNHIYTVHHSTNLSKGFGVLQGNIQGTPPMNSYTDTVNGVKMKFWKVSTEE